MQLAGKGLEEMRMKLKRAAVTERNMQESKFKKLVQARRKARAYYAKNHKPKKSKNGKPLEGHESARIEVSARDTCQW